jgi:hypothetical protein
LLPRFLVATFGSRTLFTVTHGVQLVTSNAQALKVLTSRLSSSLTKSHIVLLRATLVTVTSNGYRCGVVALQTLSDCVELIALTAIDVGAIIGEENWVCGALYNLGLAHATDALFAVCARRSDGIVATLWSWVAASAVAKVCCGTLFVI